MQALGMVRMSISTKSAVSKSESVLMMMIIASNSSARNGGKKRVEVKGEHGGI